MSVPYRLKQIELGHAKRRDDLADQISELEERLLTDEALVQVPVQKKQYTLLLAIVLEILATQAAAIGFTVFVPKAGAETGGALDGCCRLCEFEETDRAGKVMSRQV